MAKNKYVKLGKNASIFWDSTSGLKVQNKEVVPFTNRHKLSKRVDKALKNGHLEFATDEEYQDYVSDLEVVPEMIDSKKPAEVDFTKMKKQELVDHVLENSELTEEDLDGYTKSDLIELIESDYDLGYEE